MNQINVPTTEITREFHRGESYWCTDRFTNEKGEFVTDESTHPYVIVSDDEFNSHGCYVLAVMITSKPYDCDTNTILTGYKKYKNSTVKAGCIHIIPKVLIGDKICNIRRGDMENINRCMKLALGLPIEADEKEED